MISNQFSNRGIIGLTSIAVDFFKSINIHMIDTISIVIEFADLICYRIVINVNHFERNFQSFQRKCSTSNATEELQNTQWTFLLPFSPIEIVKVLYINWI